MAIFEAFTNLTKFWDTMSKQILLQLDYLKINKKRHNWNLYFVIATTDPTTPSKMAITTLSGASQDTPIKLRKASNNEIHFVPEGDAGGTGLIVLQRAMPASYSVQCRIWLMQTRSLTRVVGTALDDISKYLADNSGVQTIANLFTPKKDTPTPPVNPPPPGTPITPTLSSSSNKWVAAGTLANAGIGGVGNALEKIGDRNMGFVNLDEHFGGKIAAGGELDLHNNLSTGFAEIGWTWQVYDEPTAS